ncbi:hypothetical protein D3C86_1835100 [compost metagenome]
MVQLHFAVDRVDDGRVEERAFRFAPVFVDHLRAVRFRVGDAVVEVFDFIGFRQRGKRHAFLPRHSKFQFGNSRAEFFQECIGYAAVYPDDFQSRTTLTIKRQ